MKSIQNICNVLFFALVLCTAAFAQTTAFTYQGRLLDSSLPATGTYDLSFTLFDAELGGTALATATTPGVAVSNGIFTVQLDFGTVFDGTPRWIELGVRPTGGPSFTLLNPRQPVSSAPYSIKSLNSTVADTATNADNLGGTPASEYVETTDPRMSDARTPTPGSADYIQNQNATPQVLANFDISGTGSATIFRAGTQYNIGSARVLSNGGVQNIFVGVGAGASNPTGAGNSFFGMNAGAFNTTGFSNSFVGRLAGQSNTTGFENSFFGSGSGAGNVSGSRNSFFGSGAGGSNTLGFANSFIGQTAGINNTTGNNNAFLGASTGGGNTEGSFNSFIGSEAGGGNTTGNSNAFFGYRAGLQNITGNGNTFIGANAGQANAASNNTFIGRSAGQANTAGDANAFLGREAGRENTTGRNNAFFGFNAGVFNQVGNENAFFGDSAGLDNRSSFNSFVGRAAGRFNSTGAANSFFGYNAGGTNTTGTNNTLIGANADVSLNNLTFATAVGAGATVGNNSTIVLGRSTGADHVRIPGRLTVSGPVLLENVTAGSGFPVCINAADLIIRCPAAFTDPGAEILRQRKIIEGQQKQINGLKKLVCASNKEAVVCMEDEK